ncbi:MAG: biotin/lipoyl-binding protein [Firmicutes bacterium]|nr:biotin/lipoyl-binding protein [Bacillota bacterium]
MRKRIFCWAAVGLLMLFASGCGRSGAEPVMEEEAVAVQVEQATLGSIRETVAFSGEVAAGSEVQVMPKAGGRIIRVTAAVGQEVRKGELLVELEARELTMAVRQAEAAVEMARANLQNAK